VLSSSNSGSLVDFTAGTKDVFVDYPASKAVYEDASGNIDSYPITGGTIDNTVIGGTTPAAGTFTTLTAQTEVLRGSGQNLYVFSEQFDNGQYDKFGSTVTANSTTAPDGTTTADTLIGNGLSGNHRIDQSTKNSAPAGAPKVISVYAKANTNNFIQLYFNSDVSPFANFNLNTGTVGTVGSTSTASIVSAGNGWFRCILATTSTAATNPGVCLIASSTDSRVPTNTLSTSVFLWGIQVELGSTANTYIPTTTTAVYGTPTLSFSGVSTIGLESNGSLFVQPAGTGALQAQATTSSATGGNARGANAVDWSTSRGGASQVASATASVLAGGFANTVGGAYSGVLAGLGNSGSGVASTALGGQNQTSSGSYSAALGGYGNSSTGFYGFVGEGYANSTTSNSVIATQSATMNGTTAVTLSGSNASIKVGQLIAGTYISGPPHTYVAAISGTSLTLSQVASGSGTATLTFYTPHGVVVGGGNNTATGSYSFIGGGGDAGTAGNRNVASGDWSTVGGGTKNTASGIYSFVGGGASHSATSFGSVVCGGGTFGAGSFIGNASQGLSSFVGAGLGNTANGSYSFVSAGTFGVTRAIDGYHVFPAVNNAFGANAQGVAQSGLLLLAKQTTDATATVLTSNTNAGLTTNQVILPNNSAYFFTGEVVAGVTGGGNTKGWTIEGVIKRGANAASTALVGTPTVTSSYADAGASTWTIAVTADTTNGGLAVTFTGQASTTIRTVCQIRTTEMTY
jgi:hypothetical protein